MGICPDVANIGSATESMPKRRSLKKSIETKVLTASRRRCCLCVFLCDQHEVCRGQIAHLNHNANDPRFETLVFLCLAHHDEYDGKTSQSKALSIDEVRHYRNQLYERNPEFKSIVQREAGGWSVDFQSKQETSECEILRRRYPDQYDFTLKPCRFPLWQVANEPEFFAYKAGNKCDGVCLIERIDLPDGRIVVACIQTAGNPGNSITNCVEELCFQVCERFGLPPERLVWLEHYDHDRDHEWSMVTFAQHPPDGPFEEPNWTVMTPMMWGDLRLRPKKRLKRSFLGFESKVRKLFDWPKQNLVQEIG
jgi:hypothetical protein